MSYGLWSRRYGADPAIVGKTVTIDSQEYTVVGVMPKRFEFQFWSGPRQLWVPAGYTQGDQGRDSNSFLSFARLKPGVTIDRGAGGDGHHRPPPRGAVPPGEPGGTVRLRAHARGGNHGPSSGL